MSWRRFEQIKKGACWWWKKSALSNRNLHVFINVRGINVEGMFLRSGWFLVRRTNSVRFLALGAGIWSIFYSSIVLPLSWHGGDFSLMSPTCEHTISISLWKVKKIDFRFLLLRSMLDKADFFHHQQTPFLIRSNPIQLIKSHNLH